MKRSTSVILALGLVLFAHQASAEVAFQFAVPNFRAPDSSSVSGVRLSIIHGKNSSQKGLDLGFVAMSETAHFSGLALIFGVSRVTNTMSAGAAFSFVNWHSSRDTGMNGAFINILNNTEGAVNVGFVTIAESGTGLDIGGFNMSRSSTCQIGFLNITDRIETFQFGFLNMAKNGFLPIFPVVNFPVR